MMKLFLQENIHYISEVGIEVPFLKGKYDIICLDGIGYAKNLETGDITEVMYPKMEEIDYDQQVRIQSNRSLDKGSKIGYHDIFITFGRVKQSPK